MAQTDVRHPFPDHALHPFEYDQRDAYDAFQDVLDQSIHFGRPQHAPYVSPTPSAAAPTSEPAPFVQYTSLVGRTITSPSGSRFRLAFRHVLGVGAYGVVYLAEEIEREERRYGWFSPPASLSATRHEREQTISTAGRMYAVKVMRCAPRGSRQRVFQAREVALHRRADGHPGIVPLHAVYGTGNPPPAQSPRKRKSWSSHSVVTRPDDQLVWDRDAELSGEPLPLLENGMREELVYMVLSYVGGGDLFTLIAERHRYIGHDALVTDVFLQLVDAVAWCHDRGVKHRDLKPENVLCDQDGQRVVISDFGLATTDRWSRDFGCGSSYYMSPECYGDPLAPASMPNYDTLANDVWTLGVVLVNLATGRNPWEAASPLDPTFKLFSADPAGFLMTILPITPEANAVFTRVFERDQAQRCSLAELRQMVLGVKRWTLRGAELDNASEGARDVARGCGLTDLEAEHMVWAGSGSGSSSGSSDMAERSRFSEDTVLEADEEREGTEEGVVHWYDLIPQYAVASEHTVSSRTESACSHSSLEMSRSRPVSKILSDSPQLAMPGSWGADTQYILDAQSAEHEQRSRPQSIPRWPKMVQGWEPGEDSGGQTPRTPPSNTHTMFTADDTPRGGGEARTPKVPGSGLGTFRDGVLGSGLNSRLHTPKSSCAARAGSNPSSPFQSKIPRYTGSPRSRTGTAKSPSGALSPTSRTPGAPPFDPPVRGSTRELHSNVSTSTLSVASSESSAFPLTPIKAEIILSSPKVIISRPSDSKLWEASSSSGRSLWSESGDSQTTVWSGETHGRRALELEPGAPLFDPSTRLFGDARGERDRNRSWGAPAPLLVTGSAPRRRYHTAGEDDSARKWAASPPKQRKVKRVPVPPIPNELLEEHERQLLAKVSKGDHMVELATDGSVSRGVSPPPGLGFESRDRQVGPKRLLENARAWFRRA
ncbi:hypothetical protein FRC06_008895 [Ceratobasidium sp. 370]|nr:hypothetical protein FRC06_008895 [Ceratobasidium sp. 370]